MQETTPPSFSRLGSLHLDPTGRLPPALGKARLAECELAAGEMLYLPCGWFHEVSSVGFHCAVNFWFHPPDQPVFERPYSAMGFWRREWSRVRS